MTLMKIRPVTDNGKSGRPHVRHRPARHIDWRLIERSVIRRVRRGSISRDGIPKPQRRIAKGIGRQQKKDNQGHRHRFCFLRWLKPSCALFLWILEIACGIIIETTSAVGTLLASEAVTRSVGRGCMSAICPGRPSPGRDISRNAERTGVRRVHGKRDAGGRSKRFSEVISDLFFDEQDRQARYGKAGSGQSVY